MKVITIVKLFILIILFSSCRENKASFIKAYKYKILKLDYKEVSDTIYITKRIETDKNKSYELYLNKSDSNSIIYVIEQCVNSKKQIILINDTCKFISSKTYLVEGEKIEVFKYNLDRKNSFDEESFIYYNPDIGLIAVYNYPWSVLSYLEYDKTIGLRELFICDTSGFVLIRKKYNIKLNYK